MVCMPVIGDRVA